MRIHFIPPGKPGDAPQNGLIRILVLALLLLLVSEGRLNANTTVSGTINADTTWALTGSPYIVTGFITIQGNDGPDGITTLTIELGVEVRIQRPYYIQVGTKTGAAGALRAEGTAESTILFTSHRANPMPGDWSGIRILHTSDEVRTVFQHCIFEYADTTIRVEDAAPVFSNCLFLNGRSYDFLFAGTSSGSVEHCVITKGVNHQADGDVGFSGNTFNYDNHFPIRVSPDNVHGMVNGNVFAGLDAESHLLVSGSRLTKDAFWTNAIPYVLRHNMTIQGSDGSDGITTLTIEPGAEIRVNKNLYIQVGARTGAPGALNAEGTAESPILFKSNVPDPEPGDWHGLRILATADDEQTVLQHCTFEHAGKWGNNPSGTVGIHNAAPTLRNCEFKGSTYYNLFYLGTVGGAVEDCTIDKGVALKSDGIVLFSGNSFKWSNDFPITTNADNVHNIVNGNSFTGMDAASLLKIDSGNITRDATWTDAIPYAILRALKIQGVDGADGITTLTIEPGAKLKFAKSATMLVGDAAGAPGRLIAIGSPYKKILFTSALPSPEMNSWGGIRFNQTADPAGVLENCVAEYASTAIHLDQKADIRNCTIRHNGHGVRITDASANGSGILCNAFMGNHNGIYVVNATPTIHENNFSGNLAFGLRSGTATTLLARNNWWGDADGPNQTADKIHGNVDFTPWADTPFQCDEDLPNSPPHSPAHPQPSDGAVRISYAAVLLQWAGGDPDPLDTVTYDILLGNSEEYLTMFAHNLNGTNQRITDLLEGIVYFWKIVARDNHGQETEGPVWRFTTRGGLPDLIVSGLSTSPGGNLQAGQNVILTAMIHNVGEGPVVSPFNVLFKSGGDIIGTPLVSSVILAGEGTAASQPWIYTGGDPILEVMADANGNVSETSKNNNLFIARLSEVADNTPPILVATTPVVNSHIQQLQEVTLTLFDAQSAIDEAAVLNGFTVSDADGNTIAGAKSAMNDVFTFVPDVTPPDGDYFVSMTAIDTFGNTQSLNFGFAIDSQPPAKPIITGGTITSGTIQARPAQNQTDQFVIELTGTREAGTSVWIDGARQVEIGATPWSVWVTLTSESNSLEVWLVDQAGNQGPSEWVDLDVPVGRGIRYDYDTTGRLERIDKFE